MKKERSLEQLPLSQGSLNLQMVELYFSTKLRISLMKHRLAFSAWCRNESCAGFGGTKDTEVDVRILVASNENLWEAAQKGRFREDLYHRFNEFSLTVPALRHRGNDILEFAHHFP
jgi:transcriptional regulator of aromatic amino acid metabolism